MKIKDYVCKCGCSDFVLIPQKPATTGIYCTKCGKWFKWADKDEKNLMKLQQDQGTGLTAQQKLAIKAMMFVFDKWSDCYVGSTYLENRHNITDDNSIDFGEAYNICSKLIKGEE